MYHGERAVRLPIAVAAAVVFSSIPDAFATDPPVGSVVSDSKGEVFSTRGGALRLLVGPDASPMWIRGKVETKLTQVPVNENLHLVYTELGVYRGKRLGTPCDDI